MIGVSFGGGIGAMALAWDRRIARAHFNVPSFGNQPLRLKLQTMGSGAAVRSAHMRNRETVERTLAYYDAAVEVFGDLLNSHYDEKVYFHTPTHFLGNLECEASIGELRRMDIVLVIGEEDPFRDNNEDLCRILGSKGIGHRLHYWGERAHRGHYWRQMAPLFV